ncbi:type II toxin-antitoxin system HigA family antitoxin [Myroides sp. N17-2]|uniref:helix-turn-helix domain-containing protein n=1 Tax=Myroides sp. N17-2 TaxID=2030799 RepID=UPI000EFB4F4F|nr:hypothetical protein [Myroides sp. N17-2]
MNIKVIKTEKEYEDALTRLELIFDAVPGTDAGDEVESLSILVEKYENEHYPIDLPDPIEAIKFRMEQLGYSQGNVIR